MKHFTSTGLYTAGCMDRAPFHWIHCSRFCVKGAPCLSEGRYSSLPLIPFLMPDTVFRIEAIELVWEPGKVQPASHRRRDLEWIINITKASPFCRTKEPDSSAGVTGSLSCLPSESPSRAGSGCCLSGAEQGSPRVSWGGEEKRGGEERRGEERRGERSPFTLWDALQAGGGRGDVSTGATAEGGLYHHPCWWVDYSVMGVCYSCDWSVHRAFWQF